MWTPIKVDYNYVFEDQIMFYLKVNTNYIVVFLFWCSSVQNNPMAMIVGITFVVICRDVKKIRILGYPRIKPATDRKRILKMDTRYPWVRVFLIPAC